MTDTESLKTCNTGRGYYRTLIGSPMLEFGWSDQNWNEAIANQLLL